LGTLTKVLSFKEYCNNATSLVLELGVVNCTVICDKLKSGVNAKLLMFVLGGFGADVTPL
jgi:hypothetical protein